EIPMYDLVSEYAISYAWGKPGGDAPATEWSVGGVAKLSRADFDRLEVGKEVALFVKDEVGNHAVMLIAPFHGQPGEGGCQCDVHGGPSPGGILLAGLVAVLFFRRRRPSAARPASRLVRASRGRRLQTPRGRASRFRLFFRKRWLRRLMRSRLAVN